MAMLNKNTTIGDIKVYNELVSLKDELNTHSHNDSSVNYENVSLIGITTGGSGNVNNAIYDNHITESTQGTYHIDIQGDVEIKAVVETYNKCEFYIDDVLVSSGQTFELEWSGTIKNGIRIELQDGMVRFDTFINVIYTSGFMSKNDKRKLDNSYDKQEVNELLCYSNDTPLVKDIGGILAFNHKNGFDNVPIMTILTELLYPYVAFSINKFDISANTHANVIRYDNSYTFKSATITLTLGSNNISTVKIYDDHNLLNVSKDINDSVSSITIDFVDFNFSKNNGMSEKITVEVFDGVNTYKSDRTFNIVYPYYYGSTDSYEYVNIELNSTENVSTKGTKSYKFTINNNMPYIAYPKSYGTLSSIIDPNGFTQEWTCIEQIINDISYYVYIGPRSTGTDVNIKFSY